MNNGGGDVLLSPPVKRHHSVDCQMLLSDTTPAIQRSNGNGDKDAVTLSQMRSGLYY
jgi:hypothetical protein